MGTNALQPEATTPKLKLIAPLWHTALIAAIMLGITVALSLIHI